MKKLNAFLILLVYLIFQNSSVHSQTGINYSLVCVDSIWYDPLDSNFVYTRIFNGNVNHLNYPSVQLVDPITNDTIVNPSNYVNFFAQLGNTYQTYHDTIATQGISNFHNYTFLIREYFGDSTAVIGWCNSTGINEPGKNNFSLYPNPANDFLFIKNNGTLFRNYSLEIYTVAGEKVKSKLINPEETNSVIISKLAQGFYLAKVTDGKTTLQFKFIKQ